MLTAVRHSPLVDGIVLGLGIGVAVLLLVLVFRQCWRGFR